MPIAFFSVSNVVPILEDLQPKELHTEFAAPRIWNGILSVDHKSMPRLARQQ